VQSLGDAVTMDKHLVTPFEATAAGSFGAGLDALLKPAFAVSAADVGLMGGKALLSLAEGHPPDALKPAIAAQARSILANSTDSDAIDQATKALKLVSPNGTLSADDLQVVIKADIRYNAGSFATKPAHVLPDAAKQYVAQADDSPEKASFKSQMRTVVGDRARTILASSTDSDAIDQATAALRLVSPQGKLSADDQQMVTTAAVRFNAASIATMPAADLPDAAKKYAPQASDSAEKADFKSQMRDAIGDRAREILSGATGLDVIDQATKALQLVSPKGTLSEDDRHKVASATLHYDLPVIAKMRAEDLPKDAAPFAPQAGDSADKADFKRQLREAVGDRARTILASSPDSDAIHLATKALQLVSPNGTLSAADQQIVKKADVQYNLALIAKMPAKDLPGAAKSFAPQAGDSADKADFKSQMRGAISARAQVLLADPKTPSPARTALAGLIK
jgi:hypothetical protein